MMGDEEENESNDIMTSSSSKLCKDVSSLFLKQRFADICFIINDHKIYAHKAILAVRSKYFEALLFGGLEESKQVEITMEDIPLEVFKMILRYIYTDEICVTTSNSYLVFQVFAWTHTYCIKDLEDVITSKLKFIIDFNNVAPILNMSTLYFVTELRDACFSFIEESPLEFINKGFHDLTREALIDLVQRDTFCVSEMDIFRAIAKWREENEDPDNSVIKCVRLGCLTIDEILTEVWPMNVFTEKELLSAIVEIRAIGPRKTKWRAIFVPDVNVASLERKAEVLYRGGPEAPDISILQYGDATKDHYVYHKLKADDNITVKLQKPAVINHIHMILPQILPTTEHEYYTYYVETSLDETNWEKLVDHTEYPCRSVQNLFFENTTMRYIRIVGIYSSVNQDFRLSCLQAYYKSSVPTVLNNLVRPISNVASAENGAFVLIGSEPRELLNGDTDNYGPHSGYTYHKIQPSGSIVVQLAQPFIVSTMKLLLWDLDERHYKYYIETSVNNIDWEIAADRRNENCRSWQSIYFDERPVVFIRIVGTANTANGGFHCVHFECPSCDS